MAQQLAIQVNTPQCTGCRLCEIVCSLYHEGAVNRTKARVRVSDDYEQSLFLPHICQLCWPAPCLEACPTQALAQDLRTGIISVNEALCKGCGTCVSACPSGAATQRGFVDRQIYAEIEGALAFMAPHGPGGF